MWTLPSGKRNEALDINVYALAVLNIKKPNLNALAKRAGAAKPKPQNEADAEPQAPAPVVPKPTKTKRPATGGWMSRYR